MKRQPRRDVRDLIVVAHQQDLGRLKSGPILDAQIRAYQGTIDEDGYPFDPRRDYVTACARHHLVDCRACAAAEPF
jgi:hypothetical protein